MTRFPAAAGAAGRVLLFFLLAALGPVANGFQRLPPVVAPMRIMPRAAGCPAMAAEQRPADPGGGRALGLGRCHSAPRAGEDEGGAVRSTSGHLGTAVVRKLLGVLAALSIGSVAPPASAWGRADSAEPAAVSRLPSLEKLLQRGPDSAGYGSRPLLTPPHMFSAWALRRRPGCSECRKPAPPWCGISLLCISVLLLLTLYCMLFVVWLPQGKARHEDWRGWPAVWLGAAG